MGRLEALTPATVAETLAYLAVAPYDNVFVSWLIETGQASRGRVELWRDAADALAGVCYYGAQIVPYSDDLAGLDAFAERCRSARDARMIVGRRGNVERLWRGARGYFRKPVAIRASQHVYALARGHVRDIERDPRGDAGRATEFELDELVPNSAQMIAGEIGGNFARISGEFRDRCARIVAAGWWWRYRVDGELAFMCNVGSATAQTAQIQGVWTPPGARGRGHATRGLAAICADMLATFPTLCLYVNDFNVPAIALYERVGFARAGEFQSILID